MKLDRWVGRRTERGDEQERPRGRLGTPTPIFVTPRVAVLLTVLGIAVLAYVLYAASSILVIALGGMSLALVLSYPVRALSRLMPRGLAILMTFLTLTGLFALAVGILVPLLVQQLRTFIRNIPQIANSANAFFVDLIQPLEALDLLPVEPEDFMNNLVRELFGRAREIIEGTLGGLVGFFYGAFNFGIAIFGILFVAAYLLVDVRKFKAAFLMASPVRYRRDARELWDAFGYSLSRYLGGLLFVVLIQGVLAGAAMWALGVPYALLLGVWVSFTAIIPYIGAFLGGIPAVVIALIFKEQTLFGNSTTAVLVVVVYVLIQQLEGNFLTPRIQGRVLHVHPILVLLAVIGGGQIGGLVGVIFAVPALAVVRVIYDFLQARLRTKPQPSP